MATPVRLESQLNTPPISLPRLPWLVGGAAFLFYAVTICPRVALDQSQLLGNVAGWPGIPPMDRPALELVTLPLRWLPDGWVSLALNFESALQAALCLTLLSRCVQLLHANQSLDRRNFLQPPQRLAARRYAWVPVILSAVVCGMDPGFWREAVSTTGVMPDALLSAAGIWCVCELHHSRQPGWLDALAVFWGVGMTDSWAMVAVLPLLGAVALMAWYEVKVTRRLWFRILRSGLLGASAFWLALALAAAFGGHPGDPVGIIVHPCKNLRGQFHLAWQLARINPEAVTIVFFYALPLVPLLLRLKCENIRHLSFTARLQFRLILAGYLLALLAELGISLHPVAGPQNLLRHYTDGGGPLLSLVWLNALGAGYLAGYFHVFFADNPDSKRKAHRRFQRSYSWQARMRQTMVLGVSALPAVMALALAIRMAGPLREIRHGTAADFADLATAGLPAGGGLVLSSDSASLCSLQASLSNRPDYSRWSVVDLTALPDPAYRAKLESRHHVGFLTVGSDRPLDDNDLMCLLVQLARTQPVYLLHPGIGPLFERLTAEPQGLLLRVRPATQALSQDEKLTVATLLANESYWDEIWSNRLGQAVARLGAVRLPMPAFYSLVPLHFVDSPLGMQWFASTLNSWGVQLQYAGRWAAAGRRFDQALAFQTNNLIVRLNRDYNKSLQSGRPVEPPGAAALAQQISRAESLRQVGWLANECDVPIVAAALAGQLQSVGCPRQAAHFMRRACALAPEEPAYPLALAALYVQDRLRDPARDLLATLHQSPFAGRLTPVENARLRKLEANPWMTSTNQ